MIQIHPNYLSASNLSAPCIEKKLIESQPLYGNLLFAIHPRRNIRRTSVRLQPPQLLGPAAQRLDLLCQFTHGTWQRLELDTNEIYVGLAKISCNVASFETYMSLISILIGAFWFLTARKKKTKHS